MPQIATSACPQCGRHRARRRRASAAYVPSSPGCWMTSGEVQAEEIRRVRYPAAHRLTVDAYMAQHPGDGTDRRDRQSVFLHLLGLCAVLECGLPPDLVTAIFGRLRRRSAGFPALYRASGPGELTVTSLIGSPDLIDYERRARRWAAAVWRTWTEPHALIRQTLSRVPERLERPRCHTARPAGLSARGATRFTAPAPRAQHQPAHTLRSTLGRL